MPENTQQFKKIMNSPELAWRNAINLWRRGWSQALTSVIKRRVPPPDFAVDFLCELASGTARRNKGRPIQRFEVGRFCTDSKIKMDYQELKASGLTKEEALLTLCSKYHKSESTISQIVYPRGK